MAHDEQKSGVTKEQIDRLKNAIPLFVLFSRVKDKLPYYGFVLIVIGGIAGYDMFGTRGFFVGAFLLGMISLAFYKIINFLMSLAIKAKLKQN